MNELIFVSIPGFIVVLSIIGIWPEIITSTSDQKFVVLALMTPLLGYILHQVYRLFFEITGGYSRKSRAVVRYIVEKLAPQECMSVSYLQAYLVWEISLYDTKDFSNFLPHVSKTWHFTLAFWVTTFASIIGIIFTLCFSYYLHTPINLFIMGLQGILGIIFWRRGFNIYETLNEQEVAFLRKNEPVFIDCMKKIIK
jgi:hypothetical protein